MSVTLRQSFEFALEVHRRQCGGTLHDRTLTRSFPDNMSKGQRRLAPICNLRLDRERISITSGRSVVYFGVRHHELRSIR